MSHLSRFDGWYEQMADDELRHALVAECLDLSPRLKVTGLLRAIPHIQRFIASAVR